MLVEWLVVGSWPFWLVTVAIIAGIIAAVENQKGTWATVCFVGYLAALHLAGGVDLLTLARDNVQVIAGGLVGYLILGAAWGVAKWYFFTKKKASTIEEDYKKARREFLRDGILIPVEEKPSVGNGGAVVLNAGSAPTGNKPGVFGQLNPFNRSYQDSSSNQPQDNRPTRKINLPEATEETPVPPEYRAAWQDHIARGYYDNGTIRTSLVPPRPNDYKSLILTWMTFWPASLVWTMLNDPIRAAFRQIYANMVKTLQDISNRTFKDVTQMHAKDTTAEPPAPPSSGSTTSTNDGPLPAGSSNLTDEVRTA